MPADRWPSYFLFHRDDVHADAVAAGAHHGRDILQRQECHPLKERRHRRVPVHAVRARVEKLRTAGDEERDPVPLLALIRTGRAVVVVMIAVVVFDDAVHRSEIQQFAHAFRGKLGLVHLAQLLIGIPFAQLHPEEHVHLVLGQDLPEAPVFGIGGLDARDLGLHVIGDLACELRVFFLEILLAVVFGYRYFPAVVYLRHFSLLPSDRGPPFRPRSV